MNMRHSASSEWRNSRISILVADRSHSGTYSCSLMNTTATVVNVQVLNGELLAEVIYLRVVGVFKSFIKEKLAKGDKFRF